MFNTEATNFTITNFSKVMYLSRLHFNNKFLVLNSIYFNHPPSRALLVSFLFSNSNYFTSSSAIKTHTMILKFNYSTRIVSSQARRASGAMHSHNPPITPLQ